MSVTAIFEPGLRVSAYYHSVRRGLPVTMCHLQELGLRAARLARQHGLAAARVPEGPFWVHTWPPWVWDAAAASMAGWVPPPPYRVLVTGSRTWDDWGRLDAGLLAAAGRAGGRPVLIVHGAAGGADAMADRIALARGWAAEPHPADWVRHGKAAGFIRNAEMVAAGAGECLAFIRDGSRGASDCAARARAAGIPVYEERW